LEDKNRFQRVDWYYIL